MKMNEKHKTLYFISFLLWITFALTQVQINEYNSKPIFFNPVSGNKIYTSLDVMAFQKINYVPVNLYKGRGNVNIPLFGINTGDIRVSISFSYNCDGIKVDQRATNVRLRWSLNAGGNIFYQKKDLYDFKKKIGGLLEPDDGYEAVINWFIPSKGNLVPCKGPNNGLELQGCQHFKTDESPDLYMVNAPGLSTSFNLEINNFNHIYDESDNDYNIHFFSNSNKLVSELNYDEEILVECLAFKIREVCPNINSNIEWPTLNLPPNIYVSNNRNVFFNINGIRCFDIKNLNGIV